MALPLLLLLATTALTAGATAATSRRAADNLIRESNIKADQAKLQATQREADRKARLAEALASQNAEAGAKGIAAFEGSPLTILQEDINREKVATERDQFGANLSALSERFRGRTGASALRDQAKISILRTGATVAGGLK
jgi:hypothetical protein